MNSKMTEILEKHRCSFLESDAIMRRLKQNIECHIEEQVLVLK